MKKIKKDKKQDDPKITRKQAIKKAGYIALTSASLLILTSKQSSAASGIDNPGNGW